LESEPERISSSTTAAPPKSHVKLIAVIAIAAVAVIVGAFLVSAFLSSPQGQNAWLFKGAYATYEGSASISAEDLGSMLDMSMSIDFTIREEIVDFNSTHALVSTSFQMSSSLGEFGGETVEDENSTWVPLSEMGLMTAFEDVDLTNSYESTVSITGLGTRSCMVYEYAIAEEGLTMTVYVDKNIDWPLKMTINMTNTELPSGDLTVDINLKETNIPALK
jgi:hypothetical protein